MNDIDCCGDYYRYIMVEILELKEMLTEFLGEDVANIVLLYTPDHIAIYQQFDH